jgi:hypothetical protein
LGDLDFGDFDVGDPDLDLGDLDFGDLDPDLDLGVGVFDLGVYPGIGVPGLLIPYYVPINYTPV